MFHRHAFVKVVSLLNGKAETIEQKLLEICQTCKISLMKVAGFGSDGAAVMVGKKSGVATRLKAHNGEMISIHCGAHRLALACLQAAESITYLKCFDGHLISLFYYFKNSPVREAALHQIQEVIEEPVLHLKRAVHTRWLSTPTSEKRSFKLSTSASTYFSLTCFWKYSLSESVTVIPNRVERSRRTSSIFCR